MSVVVRTAYDGPSTLDTFRFGPHSVQLLRPGDPDRLLNDPDVFAWNRDDDYMPYWAYLWPGAFLLAEAIVRETWAPGIEALELGCGVGLAGLTALVAGVDRVLFTDYDATPLRFVAESATRNGLDPSRVRTRRLDWREPSDERFPVILGADVLYERRLVPLVTRLIATMLDPDGFALIAGPFRVSSEEEMAPCLARDGLRAETLALSSHDERGHEVQGMLHRIWIPTRPHITVK